VPNRPDGAARWPEHLPVGAFRIARSSAQYDQTVQFYSNLVGLPVLESFGGSYGEDGTIFGLPDSSVQLEIVRSTAPAVPSDADFEEATFTGDADFSRATFTGRAVFIGATFTGDADFEEATFTVAAFGAATFTGNVYFNGARFIGDSFFYGATFTGSADFNMATFTGRCHVRAGDVRRRRLRRGDVRRRRLLPGGDIHRLRLVRRDVRPIMRAGSAARPPPAIVHSASHRRPLRSPSVTSCAPLPATGCGHSS
jgi:hypothetical protein